MPCKTRAFGLPSSYSFSAILLLAAAAAAAAAAVPQSESNPVQASKVILCFNRTPSCFPRCSLWTLSFWCWPSNPGDEHCYSKTSESWTRPFENWIPPSIPNPADVGRAWVAGVIVGRSQDGRVPFLDQSRCSRGRFHRPEDRCGVSCCY